VKIPGLASRTKPFPHRTHSFYKTLKVAYEEFSSFSSNLRENVKISKVVGGLGAEFSLKPKAMKKKENILQRR